MANIKRLPCPFKRYVGEHEWYKERNERLDSVLSSHYKQTEVVVGKDGYYYQGGKCWYEFEGKAYLTTGVDFLYEMELLNAGEIGEEEYQALRSLEKLNSKLLTKSQRRALFFYRQHKHFKKQKAISLNRVRSIKQKVKEDKEK